MIRIVSANPDLEQQLRFLFDYHELNAAASATESGPAGNGTVPSADLTVLDCSVPAVLDHAQQRQLLSAQPLVILAAPQQMPQLRARLGETAMPVELPLRPIALVHLLRRLLNEHSLCPPQQ